MKKYLAVLILFGLTFFSCKKDTTPTTLDGTWKMISVTNNNTSQTLSKPSSIQGEIVITFNSTSSTNGTFIGNTPTNDIWKNSYITNSNHILTISSLAMTKVGETSWGNLFVDNILSSQQYTFATGQTLNIITTNKTLTFQKQ